MPLCERCEEKGREDKAAVWPEQDPTLCEDCAQSTWENTYESQVASYYSGGGLWAEREREHDARRLK